jgi:hypothetical protein
MILTFLLIGILEEKAKKTTIKGLEARTSAKDGKVYYIQKKGLTGLEDLNKF